MFWFEILFLLSEMLQKRPLKDDNFKPMFISQI